MMLPMVMLLGLIGASPAPSTSPGLDASFFGVHLGEPERDTIAALGETSFMGQNGPYPFRACMESHAAQHFIVSYKNGRVERIGISLDAPSPNAAAMRDAFGVSFGMTHAHVVALHPGQRMIADTSGDFVNFDAGTLVSRYGFAADGTVNSIVLIASSTALAALPELPTTPIAPIHSGRSVDDALIDIAPDEVSGVKNEYLYIMSQRCADGTTMRSAGQALLNQNKRVYDVLDVKCSGKDDGKLYFDITSYFGKD